MGFIDVDEFLVIKDRSVTDLPTLLKRFEGKGGVAVNWRLFGSSGHLQKPAGTLPQQDKLVVVFSKPVHRV